MVIFKMSASGWTSNYSLLHSEPPPFYFFYQVDQLGCASRCVTDQLSKPSSPGYGVVLCCILLSSWAKRKRHHAYEVLQPCCHPPIVRAQGLLLISLLFRCLHVCVHNQILISFISTVIFLLQVLKFLSSDNTCIGMYYIKGTFNVCIKLVIWALQCFFSIVNHREDMKAVCSLLLYYKHCH